MTQLRNQHSSVESQSLADNARKSDARGLTSKKILAPTDLSSSSMPGIRYALRMGREVDADVVILHVITLEEVVAFGRSLKKADLIAQPFHGFREFYESRLRRFLTANFGAELTSVKTKQRVELGSPETTIIEAVKSEAADLIVVSITAKRPVARRFFGSVMEGVLRNAPCPVLAIPPECAAAVSHSLRKAA